MNKRLAFSALLLIALALYSLGCDSAPNPIAPANTTLSITANPSRIDLSGQSSMITVTGFRPDGNPLNPDTQLTVSTSLGVLRTVNNINGANANIVRVNSSGRATFYLFGDGRQGTATIGAALTLNGGTGGGTGGGTDGGGGTAGGSSSVTLDVLVGDDATTLPTVTVTANPTEVDLGQPSTITVTARQVDGTPLVGEAAIVRTSLGSLSFPNGEVTNASGVVVARLTSGQSGSAEVTASVGSSAEMSATVDIGTTRIPTLEISANPSILDANGRDDAGNLIIGRNGEAQITIIARDNNGNPVGSGQRIALTTDLGTVTRSSSIDVPGGSPAITSATTDGNGEARFFFFAGSRSGAGNVTAILGNSAPASASITIRTSPAVVNLSSGQATVGGNSGSARTIDLTVRVTDNEGLPVGGEIVSFAIVGIMPSGAEVPGNFVPPSGASTNTQGVATATLEFRESDQITATSFSIVATVRTLTSEPVPIGVQ